MLVLPVALPNGSFSFAYPRAQPMPFAVRMTEPIGLPAPRALHRLLVEQRVGYRGLAVDDFGQRDGHFVVSLMRYIVSRMAATPVIVI
jgi:hypothetical protein